MSIYRIYAGADGDSHIEAVHLAQHAELGALMHVAQVGIHEFSALRTMDFHPLTERRLIIHLRGLCTKNDTLSGIFVQVTILHKKSEKPKRIHFLSDMPLPDSVG